MSNNLVAMVMIRGFAFGTPFGLLQQELNRLKASGL